MNNHQPPQKISIEYEQPSIWLHPITILCALLLAVIIGIVIYLHYNKTPPAKATDSSNKQAVATQADNERKNIPQDQGVIKKLNPNDMVVVRVPSQKEQAKKDAMLNAKNVDIIAKEVQEIEKALEKQAVEISKTETKPIANNTSIASAQQPQKIHTKTRVQPQEVQKKRVVPNSLVNNPTRVTPKTKYHASKSTVTHKPVKVINKTKPISQVKRINKKPITKTNKVQHKTKAKVKKPITVNNNYQDQNKAYNNYPPVQDNSYDDYMNKGYDPTMAHGITYQDNLSTAVQEPTNNNSSNISNFATNNNSLQQNSPQSQEFESVHNDLEDFTPVYVEPDSPLSEEDINELTNEIGVDLD